MTSTTGRSAVCAEPNPGRPQQENSSPVSPLDNFAPDVPATGIPSSGLSTEAGGKPADSVDKSLPQPDVATEPDPALEALKAVQARTGPGRVGSRDRAAGTGRTVGRSKSARRMARGKNASRRGGYSGAGPDDRDPQSISTILDSYVNQRGWSRVLADARIFSDWGAIVGPDIAAHCAPVSLEQRELRVAAESTAWATQLRLLSASLLKLLADELGPESVTRIIVTGPAAPSWKHGRLSVRGARGPRDTYG